MEIFFRWIRTRQMFGLSDIEGSEQTGIAVARERIRQCAEEAFRLCVQNHDPGEVIAIVNLARELQVMGLEDKELTTFSEGSLVERCLRFELEFESEFKLEVQRPHYTLVERAKYRSKVPLRFLYSGNYYSRFATFEGSCKLEPNGAELTLNAPPGTCTAGPVASGSSVFNAASAQINLSILSNELYAFYDPGNPTFTASATCDGYDVPLPGVGFRSTYTIVHEDELTYYGLFIADRWRTLRFLTESRGDWAEKTYERSFTNYAGPGSTLFENTRFFLRHTPDAPMPECQ